MKRILFLGLLIMLLFPLELLPVSADDRIEPAITEKNYRTEMLSLDLPELLIVNKWIDCGDYSIKLTNQPILTAVSAGLNATEDNSYLILRIALRNNTDHILAWLDPESFHVQEYYLNIYGAYYPLCSYLSAKTSDQYQQPTFFSAILPRKEISTTVAFEVYDGVDGWVFTFRPFTREQSEPGQVVSFTLPLIKR